MSELSAGDIIRLLDLQPHPEGGHFRETFRDPRTDADGRSASTAIYFLLKAGEVSRWHRVDAAEVWHWYAGAPLELSIAENDRIIAKLTLGSGLGDGQRPQAVVPARHWQSAQPRSLDPRRLYRRARFRVFPIRAGRCHVSAHNLIDRSLLRNAR
jgi:uncharacterized protein